MADQPPYPGAPGWVKISAIVIGVIVVLLVILMLSGIGGRHGPGRHLMSGAADEAPSFQLGEKPASSVDGLDGHTRSEGGLS